MSSTQRGNRPSISGRRFAAVASIAAATVVGAAASSIPARASASDSTAVPVAAAAAPGNDPALMFGTGAATTGLLSHTFKPVFNRVLPPVVKPAVTAKPKAQAKPKATKPHTSHSKSHATSHSTSHPSTGTSHTVAYSSSFGAKIVAAAAAEKGRPYRYGADGPYAFDCSGLVKYVFGKFGINLPHHADSQMSYGTRVSASAARPGDLVFVVSGGYASHVGIYAGNGEWWEAPSPGESVHLVKIWASNVEYRRIR